MKKLSIILSFMLLIVLWGCSDNTEPKNIYSISIDDKTVLVGEEFQNVKEMLGAEKDYFEAESCAFDGLDRTYTYDDLILTTFEDNKVEKIYSIELLNDRISTGYNVKIGDSLEKIKEAHEALEQISGTDIYEYKDNNSNQMISYYTDGNKIETIIITLITQ